MKDEYLYLKQGEEACKEVISNAEKLIYMNQLILHTIEKRLKEVPKPKLKDAKSNL